MKRIFLIIGLLVATNCALVSNKASAQFSFKAPGNKPPVLQKQFTPRPQSSQQSRSKSNGPPRHISDVDQSNGPINKPIHIPRPPVQPEHNIWKDVAKGIAKGLQDYPPQRPTQRPPFRPQQNYPPQTYPQPRPVYIQPTAPPPPRVTSLPPRNTVVAKKPPKNPAFALSNADFENALAVTDAQQSVEAAKLGGKLDTAIETGILSSPLLDDKKKKEANRAWAEAVLSGDPQKFEEFQRNFGKDLPLHTQSLLDNRIAAANFGAALEAGTMTADEKDAGLRDLRDRIDAMNPGVLKEGLQSNIVKMEQFNDLGKIIALSQGNDDALQVMMVGVETAGFESEFIADLTNLPIMVNEAIPDSTIKVAEILLLNNAELEITYKIGTHSYVMEPGYRQSLKQSCNISFVPKPGVPARQYNLTTGAYHFVYADAAWDLVKLKPKAVIDNSHYSGTFKYLINGQEASLAAGEVSEVTDSTAIVIEFDRGGGEPARKLLVSGKYEVGIDAKTQLLDLYEVTETPEASAPAPVIASKGAVGKKSSRAAQIEAALARLKGRSN